MHIIIEYPDAGGAQARLSGRRTPFAHGATDAHAMGRLMSILAHQDMIKITRRLPDPDTGVCSESVLGDCEVRI